MEETKKDFPRYITISSWKKYHSWPPEGGLRHLIFNAKKNGFDQVIKKVGSRILIDEQKFFEWVEDQNKKPPR